MESKGYLSEISQRFLMIKTSIQTFSEPKLSPQTLQMHLFPFQCIDIYT